MFVESLEVTGLRHLPSDTLALGRFEAISGSHFYVASLRRALLLSTALFDPAALVAVLESWGCEGVALHAPENRVESAQWSAGRGLAAVLDPEAGGQARVRATFRLDPVQFGQLRAAAVRDPRLVDALAGGSTLVVHTGLRFHPAFDGLSLDALGVVVGGVSFPASGPDSPAWLGPLLARLGGRVVAQPLAPGRWQEVASSWSATGQAHLAEALAALARPPAAVGRVLPLRGEPACLVGAELVPVRLLDWAQRAAVGWVGAALVQRPDVLVALGAPDSPAWRRWWRRQVEGEQSPLEQVILLREARGRRPRP